MATRFPYSDQVFAYVPKPMKKRLRALRKVDPRRYSESRVIQMCLEKGVPEIEHEVHFNQPTKQNPGKSAA